MRILVTGSRNYKDSELMYDTLSVYPEGTELAHGGALGADSMAGKIGNALNFKVKVYPANWAAYRKAAGPIRNQWMLDDFKPDIVYAFPMPDSRGTWDMIRRAMDAGIEVKIVRSV